MANSNASMAARRACRCCSSCSCSCSHCNAGDARRAGSPPPHSPKSSRPCSNDREPIEPVRPDRRTRRLSIRRPAYPIETGSTNSTRANAPRQPPAQFGRGRIPPLRTRYFFLKRRQGGSRRPLRSAATTSDRICLCRSCSKVWRSSSQTGLLASKSANCRRTPTRDASAPRPQS